MAKGALTKSPKTGGKVYAGGSPNFDESKGRYTSPPRGSERLSPGVYRTPSGGLMSGKGRPLPSTGQQGGQALAGNLRGAQNSGNLIGSMPPGTNINELINGVTGLNNKSNNVFGPKGPAPVDMQRPFMNQPAFSPEQYPLSQGMMAPQQQALSIFDVMKMNSQQQQQAFAQRPSAPMAGQMPPQQMPQPSANMGGQYRLSPGVYGTREQAMQQMYQRVPGLQNGLGQQGNMPPIDWSQAVFYGQRKGY